MKIAIWQIILNAIYNKAKKIIYAELEILKSIVISVIFKQSQYLALKDLQQLYAGKLYL